MDEIRFTITGPKHCMFAHLLPAWFPRVIMSWSETDSGAEVDACLRHTRAAFRWLRCESRAAR